MAHIITFFLLLSGFVGILANTEFDPLGYVAYCPCMGKNRNN